MKKIVLTGGPCSGKSTILGALREEFQDEVTMVPEAATLLLDGGFPAPGRDLPWSEEWQSAFQKVVLPLQCSLEDTYALMAAGKGSSVLVCDRGMLDGAAYTPGGLEEFSQLFQINVAASLARYAAVVHLQSLATVEPSKYGKVGNQVRFEPLERAQQLDQATRAAWSGHACHMVVDGRRGIDGKISQVIGMVKMLLASK